MLRVGDRVAGYEIQGVLGRGGMAVVYEARQIALERTVALKILPAELSGDEAFRERFRREGVLQATLDHPHIVTIYEAGDTEDNLFLAMRLVRGATLKQLIRAGQLDAGRAMRLLSPVADALDAAHAGGLVHRDIKPQNILVDERDHPYLADFGLTRTPESPGFTDTGEFFGTPEYVAPEQIQGRPATAAADLYAFAAVLYECLTGCLPYVRETALAVLWAHVNDPVPHVRDLLPDLPVALDRAIARGMAKQPEDRHGSAVELMAEAWEALAAGAATAPAGHVPASPGETGRGDPAGPPRAPAAERARPRPRARRPLLLAALVPAAAAAALLAALVVFRDDGGERQRGRVPAVVPGALGSLLGREGAGSGCTEQTPAEGCTVVQTRLPGRPLAAPFDGVLTGWRVRDAEGTLKLVVLRGRRRMTAISVSDPVQVTAPGEQAFDARLAIARGDRVGLELGSGARLGLAPLPRATVERWTPALAAGVASRRTTSSGEEELLLAAQLERDQDQDGWGDATQDRCLGEKGGRAGCRAAGSQLSAYRASFYDASPPSAWTQVADEAPRGRRTRHSQWRSPESQHVSLSIDAADGAASSPQAGARAARGRVGGGPGYSELAFGRGDVAGRAAHVWIYRLGRLQVVEYRFNECGDAFAVRGVAPGRRFAKLTRAFRAVAGSVRSNCD